MMKKVKAENAIFVSSMSPILKIDNQALSRYFFAIFRLKRIKKMISRQEYKTCLPSRTKLFMVADRDCQLINLSLWRRRSAQYYDHFWL